VRGVVRRGIFGQLGIARDIADQTRRRAT